METVFLGIGSNMGDEAANIGAAIGMVEDLDGATVLRVSRLYESAPWGVSDQPMFANAVVEIATSVPADSLLDALQAIEQELGRRPGPRFGPRLIDIDILLYGSEEWDSDRLTIPHVRMLERDFVVTPLLEIDPDVRLPDGSQVTREHVKHGAVTDILGLVPGFEDRAVAIDAHERSLGHRHRQNEDWVELCAFGDWLTNSMKAQSAPDVSFLITVFEAERIPFAWDPYPPQESFNPYGFSAKFKLMVPSVFQARASRLIDEVAKAEIDWTDPGLSGA
ncbi:MAG: 2-amino-4-hydroxy-6-hydroxymethyldihydropteridine diphosphokinase [Actinomycetota bacterium]|jgi:2-amino-4-hydroxy-6-hydroxymethyldihydropteridine diphosphokinase|nr:2-amino-4-hydroxy-6-hydroxymethyldihydropteridine diphosphokinase [Actinomycetota bacterium]